MRSAFRRRSPALIGAIVVSTILATFLNVSAVQAAEVAPQVAATDVAPALDGLVAYYPFTKTSDAVSDYAGGADGVLHSGASQVDVSNRRGSAPGWCCSSTAPPVTSPLR